MTFGYRLTVVSFVLAFGLFTSGKVDAADPAKAEGDGQFARPVIDLGVVVSDLDRAMKFYTEAIGFTKVGEFSVNADFCRDAGLTDSHELNIQVLALDGDEQGTKLKLMHLPGVKSKRGDHKFIHSQLGFSYLTIFVKDSDAALARLKKAGVKPVAKDQVRVPLKTPVPMFLTVVADPDGNLVELVGPQPKKN